MQTGAIGSAAREWVSKHRTGEMEQCMANCLECARVCLETIPQCLELGGKHSTPEHISMLINCARICQVSAEYLVTGSKQHVYTCGACAEVCRECADDCARTGREPFMQRCTEVCTRCADSCKKMSAH